MENHEAGAVLADLEDVAAANRAACPGRSIERAVGGFHHPGERNGTIVVVKDVQNPNVRSVASESEDDAGAVKAAVDGGPVQDPVGGFDELGGRISAIRHVRIVEVVEIQEPRAIFIDLEDDAITVHPA